MPVEKRNIFLRETQDVLPYVSGSKRSSISFPKRDDPRAHASFISRKLTIFGELSAVSVFTIDFFDACGKLSKTFR